MAYFPPRLGAMEGHPSRVEEAEGETVQEENSDESRAPHDPGARLLRIQLAVRERIGVVTG